MIIAIDGPSASGKGTVGRLIAEHYGFVHLDTGLLYRAVAYALLTDHLDLSDEESAVLKAKNLNLSQMPLISLRSQACAEGASRVASLPGVRLALLDLQRHFAQTPPGAVLDGRDIGTIVCPYADVKLYITASAEIRAQRRYEDARRAGHNTTLAQSLSETLRRDERDQNRPIAPLRLAHDALLLDTTNWDITKTVEEALALIERAKPPLSL